MLTKRDDRHSGGSPASDATLDFDDNTSALVSQTSALSRVLRVEWLGQTIASFCWIASVFSYGISSTGDWLQLSAATAWLLANIASIVVTDQ